MQSREKVGREVIAELLVQVVYYKEVNVSVGIPPKRRNIIFIYTKRLC